MKTCAHCKEEMKSEATVCPHCQRAQSWLDSRDPRKLILAGALWVVIFIVAFVGIDYVVSPIVDSLDDQPRQILKEEVTISNSSFSFIQGDCGTKVVTIGTLRNESKHEIQHPELTISFYDDNAELVDVVEKSMWSESLASSEEISFRASACPATSSTSDYDNHSIKVMGRLKLEE